MEREKDVHGLIRAVEGRDWALRCDAGSLFGRIGDGRAIEPLIQALTFFHNSQNRNLLGLSSMCNVQVKAGVSPTKQSIC